MNKSLHIQKMQQQVCKIKKSKSAKKSAYSKMVKDFVFNKSSQKSTQVCIFQYNISIFGNKWVMPKALLYKNHYM